MKRQVVSKMWRWEADSGMFPPGREVIRVLSTGPFQGWVRGSLGTRDWSCPSTSGTSSHGEGRWYMVTQGAEEVGRMFQGEGP